MSPPAHRVPPHPGMALLARPRCGCSCCGVKLLFLHAFHGSESKGTKRGLVLAMPQRCPPELGAHCSPHRAPQPCSRRMYPRATGSRIQHCWREKK